uniref:Eukaryotic translation initiation factor 4E n=1 Tax=Melanaphis sacchari TaxID=742174 RepID=A0A2H8TGI6_9HEMI
MSEEQGENTRMNVAKDESPEVENKELNETEKDVAIMQSDDKHLLENKWTFWYYEPKGKISAENLHKVTSFDTVEDFWCLFNHIKKPSQLSLQSHYSYFKYGIKPNWDDDKNSAGGRWILEIPLSNKIHLIDEYWMKIK